ncbi:MAG: magnesium/cobalt transporter CorA [Acidimicrobiales bacterium]|nr:magnesium/cobalt transporter CorA [Acidimicrobiales bacterium]
MISVRHYRTGAPGVEIGDPETIDQHLAEQDGLVWVDVDAPTPEDVKLLVEEFDVHHLAAEDLLEARQRPKLERYGNHFLLVARDCRLEDTTLVAMEIDVVFGDGWIITVRKPSHLGHEPVSLDEVARHFERQRSGEGATDEGFLLYVLLDTLVDRYFVVVDQLEERLEDLEELVFGEEGQGAPVASSDAVELQRTMFRLRSTLMGLRRSVAPLREVLGALQRREVPFLGEAAVMHLQDVYDHVLRIVDLNESQRELLTAVQEARIAIAGNRMNQVMKTMTSWGAILLGSTLIAGIYGMNFRYMPELDWRYGYPMALTMMLVLTVGLFRWFKRHEWL